eukprot:GHRR01007708.1.p1 GENE.GHRR01007708.1~~GHRR01007708.1.p1  ORF type:complete len:657 (+),score=194.76 GHRR01007708.1:252-2222(+)
MGSQRLWALLCLLFVPSASSSYNIHRFYQIQEQTPCQPWTVDPSERCSYVIDHADACYPDGGWQMYLRVHFCTFGHWQWVSHMILILGALLAFGVLLTISERFFCPALELISEYLRMPPVVAGATLLSFGNGAPDIFTQVAAVGQGGAAAIGMALAEPLGGGLFASNIVFGSVVLVATSISNVKIQKVPFFKDVGFYLLSLLLMAALLADHKAELWEALLMCGVYATYVFVTFWVSRNDEPVHADLTLHEVPQEEGVDVPDSCSEVFSEQPEFVDAGTSMTPLASTTAGHFSTTPRKNGTPRGCTDWTQHSALLWRPRHPLKEPLLASGGEALPGQPGNHAAAVAEATTSTADAAECGVVACNAGSSNSVQGGSPRNGLLGASPCAASPRSGLSGASPYAASPRAGLAPAGGDAGSHTVSQSDTASPSARAAAARQFKRFQSFPGAVSVHVQHPDSSISGTIGGLLSPRVSYGADNLFSPTSAHSLASSRPSSSMGYQARPGLAPLVQQMQEQHLEQQQDLLEAQFEEHLVLVQQHEEEQEVKKKGFSWKHRLQNPLMQVLMCTMPRVGTGYGHHYQRWRACVLPLTAPLTVVLAAPSLATSISPAGMGFGAVCAAVGATIIWATYPASNVPRKYLKGRCIGLCCVLDPSIPKVHQ